MKGIIKKINSIHEFTYMFFMISVETAILVLLLSVYYTTMAYSFANTIYYLRIASELLIGVKELLIFTLIYSVIIEFVLRNKEKG